LEITKSLEKDILDYASKKKMLLEGGALEALAKAPDFAKVIDSLESESVFIVSRELVEKKSILLADKPKSSIEPKGTVEGGAFRATAKDFDSNLEVLREYDVTDQSCSEGKVTDFLNYFRNKFELLSDILRRRHTLSPKPIKRLKGVAKNEAVDIIGMVYRKWVTKNGHVAFQLEDFEAKCIVLVLKDNAQLTALSERIMLDDVLGIKGTKFAEQLVIAKEILWPDLPMKQPKTVDVPVNIASISDMHVGSKLFLERGFNRFLEWINCRAGTKKEREKAGSIKYLLVTGDNVDGIGIYPKQFDELNIRDIGSQYDEFSRLIAEIPDYIEIVICPGQHDAVRWADPQPAIPKQFAKELHELGNVHFVGSPGWLAIEGLKVLLYHGSCLHDLISSVSFLNSTEPEKATIELLKKRDLMPAYGLKQPYVPEKKDFMVIREEPDLFFLGDMHHNSYGNYRGTTIVHNGTWQARTAYQVKLGHVPTPGIVPIIELCSRKITETAFLGAE
jgi:DNA polymerase II small subunit